METSKKQQAEIDVVSKEKIPLADQVVIATNCLYRNYQVLTEGEQRDPSDTDGIRGDLALQLFQKGINMGIRMVVCDGGSSPQFLSTLQAFEDKGLTVVTSQIPGRGPQRRRAFETAAALAGCRAVVYTQAEKTSLLDENNLAEVTKPILEDEADIVVLKRNPELFEQSYPPYMRESELRVNETYNWLMHRNKLMDEEESFDWFFGPVVFRNEREIVDMFLKRYEVDGLIRSRIGAEPNPEMHSDGHYFPIIEALFRGKRVLSVEIPFVYPKLQKANEMSPEKIAAFRDRRQKDGAAYRLEAIHFLEYLKGNPNSKIREIQNAN